MNKLIIIGDDNVNTLGVIWSFSKHSIKVDLMILNSFSRVSVIKSKNVEKYYFINDEDDLINSLNLYYINEVNKPVIITTSDLSTLIIDKNYDSLCSNFIISSIDNKQGNINKYMDKYNQYRLSNKHKIKMAKTKIVDLKANYNLDFPCILKPIVSASGKKADIRICNNYTEFNDTKKELLSLNYNKMLYQEFLNYDYELDICGFSYNGKVSIPGYIEKERIWPAGRGSTTFGKVKPNNDILNVISDISKIMRDINYNGIFDIEVFVTEKGNNKEFYLNEINFRNSAVAYSYGKSAVCYYWYLSCINNKMILAPSIDKGYYTINEQADLHNLFEKKISLFRYWSDLRKSKIKINFNIRDIKPCIYACLYKFFR